VAHAEDGGTLKAKKWRLSYCRDDMLKCRNNYEAVERKRNDLSDR